MRSTIYTPVEDDPRVSDDDLIKSVCRGDKSGFDQLVRRYQDRLFRSMLIEVGSPALAEDVIQDAFERAFRFLHTFQYRSHFYTWLYRIARNSHQAYLRKNRKTIELESIGDQPTGMWTHSHDSPPQRMERLEDRNQVRSALARMDEKYRRILILREFDGLDYQSIAEILNLNIGTVRSRLARARARLRNELVAYVNAKPTRPTKRTVFIARRPSRQ